MLKSDHCILSRYVHLLELGHWLIDWLTSIEHYYSYINGKNTTTNKCKINKRRELLLVVFLYIGIAWVFQLFNITTEISTCISHIAKNYEKNYIIDKVRSFRNTVSVIFHWLGIYDEITFINYLNKICVFHSYCSSIIVRDMGV